MGSLELGPEADVSQLEPLLTLENIEQLEATFVSKVQASVVQWLQKALEGEVAEWGREREPDTDPSGFYHSPMPAIVLQILEENIRVTSLVSESLQRRVHGMALSELGAFLRSSSVSVLQPEGVVSGALAPVEAALDELQRRICRLVLEALLLELQVRLQVGLRVGGDKAYVWESLRGNSGSGSSFQPLFATLPSRRWLSSPELLNNVCERTARFCQNFWRVRNPAFQVLLAETERAVVLQYLRALMQGRLVCRGADERNQAAERLQQDATQLRDLFLDLVRACWASRWV
ncbi:Exocyst complex component 3-like protein [Myotis davidii]|uniref:Exocyst complex component 3-like protein n=1 Tax=Myotis davidii TaxID=225400 RepID=L5LI97_MYODS|nr:Exocyst complex component 3-like protein [Myotis davidii]